MPESAGGAVGGGGAGPRSTIARCARWIEPRDFRSRHRQPAEATGPAPPPPAAPPADSTVVLVGSRTRWAIPRHRWWGKDQRAAVAIERFHGPRDRLLPGGRDR